MMFATFLDRLHWRPRTAVHRRRAGTRKRSSKPRRPWVPRLEPLEERWAPAVYNNAAQFGFDTNPKGVWSYGYLAPSSTPETPDASTFTRYNGSAQVSGHGGYILEWSVPGGSDPNTIYNPFGQPVTIDTATWQPNQASFHPGPNGEYSVYRFTAAQAGSYPLSATFTSIDTVGRATKDIHVLLNGSELYDATLPGSYGSAATYSTTVSLAVGDVVDFVVGYGVGPYYYDSTALDATLGAVVRTTTALNGPATSTAGQAVTYTATVSGSAVPVTAGSVTFLDNGTPVGGALPLDANGQATITLAPPVAGIHTIWASYSGLFGANVTTGFSQSAASTTLTVNPTTLTINPSTASPIPGQYVAFNAVITPAVPINATPTGSVSLIDTTTNTFLGYVYPPYGEYLGPFSSLGPHVIQATYSGDSNFAPSSTTLTLNVTQSIFVLNLTANAALSVVNNGSIVIPGNIVVDSSGKSAITESNNARIAAGGSIQAVGGVSLSSSATISPAPTTGAAVFPDPMAVGGFSPGGTPVAVSLTKGSLTIGPGLYSAINVSGSTASLTMTPGLYVIAGPAGFTVSNGASVTGNGIMIYNTSDANGKFGGISIGGSGAPVSVNLTAAGDGPYNYPAPYPGLVIFQDPLNTRAISLGSNTVSGGVSGTIYAKAALLTLSGNATLNGAVVVDKLQVMGNASATQTVAGASADGTGSTPGELLASNLEVYVNDPSGLFTSDEFARIQDAVNAVNAIVQPYGVSVSETTDPTQANVIVDTGSTSAAGGYSDGVLGCYTTAGEITLIQGWSWYAGSDPTPIGAGQYDFETTVIHELGHALGLGESSDPTSAMSGTLATGTVIRTLTTADLNIPYADANADAQHAGPDREAMAPVTVINAAAPGSFQLNLQHQEGYVAARQTQWQFEVNAEQYQSAVVGPVILLAPTDSSGERSDLELQASSLRQFELTLATCAGRVSAIDQDPSAISFHRQERSDKRVDVVAANARIVLAHRSAAVSVLMQRWAQQDEHPNRFQPTASVVLDDSADPMPVDSNYRTPTVGDAVAAMLGLAAVSYTPAALLREPRCKVEKTRLRRPGAVVCD
jgi:Bacterial Ig-like domain (group 3)